MVSPATLLVHRPSGVSAIRRVGDPTFRATHISKSAIQKSEIFHDKPSSDTPAVLFWNHTLPAVLTTEKFSGVCIFFSLRNRLLPRAETFLSGCAEASPLVYVSIFSICLRGRTPYTLLAGFNGKTATLSPFFCSETWRKTSSIILNLPYLPSKTEPPHLCT